MIDRSSPYFKQTELLFRLLPIIAQEESFALKGGTAINMFIRDLPRLSVDADLTYIPVAPRQESLQTINDALARIETNIKARISGSIVRRHQLGQEPFCMKLTIINGGVQVVIETASVMRGTVFAPERRAPSALTQELFGFVSMKVVSIADLYGGKICAALDRQHPRDLFDLMVLFENEGITSDIRKAFVVYLACHDRPISELLAPDLLDLRKTFDGEFQGMTTRDVTYEGLLKIWNHLRTIIPRELTGEERGFLVSLKKGEPQWDLLGIDGMERLPALQWKLANIRKMKPKKHAYALEKLSSILEV